MKSTRLMFMILALANFTCRVNSQLAKNIFLLGGQSNMFGVGGVVKNNWDGVIPPECKPNPAILKLDAKLQRVEAKEPLHNDIDTNVTSGIGPGMPYENAILKNDSRLGVLGLVPCAVSGSKITNWQKRTLLYNQLVRRAKAAVRGGGVIRAMHWYQGESDTVRKTDADAYRGRMQKFVTDLRNDLGIPKLLIIQVALASGGKHYTGIVREAQLKLGLPNIITVDAQGLPLQKDNFHLTTPSQVRLGGMLAAAFLRTLEINKPKFKEIFQLSPQLVYNKKI